MTRPRYRLAIVGGGPRATYVLERLAAKLSRDKPVGLEITVFERTGEFGAGWAHSPSQARTSQLNRIASQISFVADESAAAIPGIGPIRSKSQQLNLAEWAQQKYRETGIEDFNISSRSWPKRYVHGLALVEFFARYTKELNQLINVSVNLRAAEVIHINRVEHLGSPREEYTVIDRGGQEIIVDEVLLLTGHNFQDPLATLETKKLAEFSKKHKVKYVSEAYPLRENIGKGIARNSDVVFLRGTGLVAIDVILHLTEGRGGEFTPRIGSYLDYNASGAEPRIIIPLGRSGLFPYARPCNLDEIPPLIREFKGIFFNKATIDQLALRTAGGAAVLNFRQHLMPIILLEMAIVHYAVELNVSAVVQAVEAIRPKFWLYMSNRQSEDPPSTSELADSFAVELQKWCVQEGVEFPRKRFDWPRLVDPLRGVAPGAGYQRKLIALVEQDIDCAENGLLDDSMKASTYGVWRELRSYMAYVWDEGMLAADSRDYFRRHVSSFHNRLANGASPEVMAKVAALLRSGVLDMSMGPGAKVVTDSTKMKYLAQSKDGTRKIYGDALIEARLPEQNPQLDKAPLFRSMIANGLMRDTQSEKILPSSGSDGKDYLPVDRSLRVEVSEQEVSVAINVLGPPAAARRSFQLSALRPGHNASVLTDVGVWLTGFWSRLYRMDPKVTAAASTTGDPSPLEVREEKGMKYIQSDTKPFLTSRSQTLPFPYESAESVAVIIDEPTNGPAIADVILAPAFGSTAQSMFPFAYCYARNGFRVIRLDFRQHVGRSVGEIQDAQLSLQVADLKAVMAEFPAAIIVAVSLANRPVIRALAEMNRHSENIFPGAVLMTPVIDLGSTLEAVMGVNYVYVPDEELPSTVEVIGYTVKGTFVADARRHELLLLQETESDLQKIASPLSFIAGDEDPWVEHHEVERVVRQRLTTGAPTYLTSIPAGSHRLNRSPSMAARYIESSVQECLRLAHNPAEAFVPSFDETMRALNFSRAAQPKQV